MATTSVFIGVEWGWNEQNGANQMNRRMTLVFLRAARAAVFFPTSADVRVISTKKSAGETGGFEVGRVREQRVE
jgi:hypothetical protein